MNIKTLIKFTDFINKFREVERLMLFRGSDRLENDSEHSFQLAIIAWYIISTENLDLNLDKIFKYCLAHDLVEIYAGDVPFYQQDTQTVNLKSKNEHEAAQRIAIEFSDFTELHSVIQSYENKSDEESQFVYALDKMLPVINIYLDNGRSWHEHKVSYQKLRSKDAKVKVSPPIEKYWFELVEILDKDKDQLFPS